MAVRTLDQIINELNASSAPQIESIRNRKQGLAGELQADEQALKGQQNRAFGDILTGARRRGLGFSGIPLGEQAEYASDVYLPALTRSRNDFRNRELSLEEAIQGIYSGNRNQAQTLRQGELDRAEQIRQYNESLAFQREQAARSAAAARAASATPSWVSALFGNQGGQTQSTPAVDPDARYKKWLSSQLRVSNTPTRTLQSGSGVRLQGSSPRLQGSSPRLQGGGMSLQGNRSRPISGGLRVR